MFDPPQVLGSYVCPTVGEYWLLATYRIVAGACSGVGLPIARGHRHTCSSAEMAISTQVGLRKYLPCESQAERSRFRSGEGLGNVRKEAVPAAVKVTVSLDDIVPAFRVEELGFGFGGSDWRIEGLRIRDERLGIMI